MELTKEQAITEFRRMWKWIAEESLKQKRCVSKEEYLKRHEKFPHVKNNSFICEYACQEKIACCNCPILWDCPSETCYNLGYSLIGGQENYSSYDMLVIQAKYEKYAFYANKISELPERQEQIEENCTWDI